MGLTGLGPVMAATAAGAAFATTFALVLLLRPLSLRVGLVDRPGGRKRHEHPTPTTGGAALVLGVAPALAFFSADRTLQGLAAAATILLIVGLADDRYRLAWGWRLVFQAVAALTMAAGGVVVESLGPGVAGQSLDLRPFTVPCTVLVVVGVINAFNMADGADGLAGLLAFAALSMIAAVAVKVGAAGFACELLPLLAGVAAFLVFNLRRPGQGRARVFLGDGGSAFLGLAVAWASIRLTQDPQHVVTPALAPFFAAPPVIDCLTVIVRRIGHGRSPFLPDLNHAHHRLLEAGLSTTAVALSISAASLVAGAAGILAVQAGASGPALAVAFGALAAAHLGLTSRPRRFGALFSSAVRAALRRAIRREARAGGDGGALAVIRALALTLVLAPAGPAAAAPPPPLARLVSPEGVVLLDPAGRYVPATSGAPLKAGDRLLVLKGATQVVYGDGCSLAVNAGSLVVIQPTPPCRELNAGSIQTLFGSEPAASGSASPGAVSSGGDPPAAVARSGLSLKWLAIGGGAALAAGGAAVAGSAGGRGSGGTAEPASP